MTFEPNDDGVPNLMAQPGSVLADLSGEVLLGPIRRCHLAGTPRGFTIAGLGVGATSDAQPMRDSVLTGFKLPEGLVGRQLLSEMTDVYQLSPHTGDLPGWQFRWSIQHPWRLNPALDHINMPDGGEPVAPDEQARRLRHNAEFMRELQRLAAEKGAPGATRTKIAWCAYRLRHLTTDGRMERFALALYRTIGYGERPMPAVILWLVLSAVSAAFALDWNPDPSVAGLWRFVAETWRQAIGPLTGLLHGGSPPLQHDRDYLFRAVVAIPLVTALFAFRNYVKGR